MRFKIPALLTVLALGVALSPAWSASAQGHFVDPMNVPLHVKKGEARLSAAMGQKGEGLHLKGSTAVNDLIALVAAGSYAQKDRCLSCNTSVRRHFEIGAGSFRTSGDGFVREMYAGVGTGRFKASGESGQWDPQAEDILVTSGHYDQFFLQGDIGRPKKYSTLAGAARLSGYRYYGFSKVDGNGTVLPMAASHWGLFLEPAVTYCFGFRKVKVETQFGASIPLVEASGINGDRLWLSLGMGLDLFGG